ncbi:MAG: response regulator transcription factor, partial [Polaromonas sp.]
ILQEGVPELICLDLKLPDTNGVSGVRELKLQYPDVPLVVLSAAPAQDYEELALEAGADAYIQKSAGATEISNVLRVFLGNELEPEPAPTEKLSKRQKQLLVMLDKGMSNRDIAEELQISEHTVKVHLWRLFRRLNVKSRSQASHLARTQGLL